jgi:predicted nucleotidyltransferase
MAGLEMTDDVLVKSRPPVSVLDFSKEEIIDWLESALSGRRVDKTFLFGSVAESTAEAWSDIDLIIVKESQTPFIERPKEFWDLHDLGLAIDILVYTPAEFIKMEEESNPFWKEAKRSRIELKLREN